MTYILDLRDCAETAADRVGGKARGLHFLIQQKLPVPPGFVVTTDAYRAFVVAAGIEPQLEKIAASAQTPTECQAASAEIGLLFLHSALSIDIASEIEASYLALDAGSSCTVAVRSSATAEDTAEASFAGQQETYLHIDGVANVVRHVVKCWASLFTAQAIGYRARFGVNPGGLAMAVVVQRMVPSEAAGVLMSLDPSTGDTSCIYIESAMGLGEGVVRGDVGCDRFWVDKASLKLIRQEINAKKSAHRFDAVLQTVRIMDVPAEFQLISSLHPPEIIELTRLAKQAEQAFGSAVDMEWGIAANIDKTRTIYLLQARAETVWAKKIASDGAEQAQSDDWDTLHNRSAPDLHWSTSNYGEAIPGVSTTLNWDIWSTSAETTMRSAAYAIGALTKAEAKVSHDVNQRITRIFFGRPALQVEYLATLGDRMPGTTGQQVVQDLLGSVPEDMQFQPTRRRYPVIAWRFPWTFITAPGRLRRLSAKTEPWWLDNVSRAKIMDLTTARTSLKTAIHHFVEAMKLQAITRMGVVTPLYNALGALVSKTGIGDTAMLSGFGGAEMDMVIDIWRASRREIDIDQVIRKHGYHGPLEGELSSLVWREDDLPLRKLIEEYAARSDQQDPRLQRASRALAAQKVVQQTLAAVLPLQRPFVRLLLRLAAKRMPLTGVAKSSYVRAFDVARAMTRRIGQLLLKEKRIDALDDVFYLTVEELCGAMPGNARELIKLRRQRRSHYMALTLPGEWKGMPQPIIAKQFSDKSSTAIRGTGVSPGVIVGRARVLLTPDFAVVEPGEILVSPTTDPSWSSVMFISSGLVVDIGGALSHAAIVARELGIPCVVNTQDGSRRLFTGDLIRVDGSLGSIEILERFIATQASKD